MCLVHVQMLPQCIQLASVVLARFPIGLRMALSGVLKSPLCSAALLLKPNMTGPMEQSR